MAYQTENTLQKRIDRVKAAAACKEGDRVPFAPKVNLVYAQAAGLTGYEALMDYRMMKEGVVNFLSRYESDLFWCPANYPANVMEVLGTTAVRWPGATCGIDHTKSFQVVDNCYLEEDEYDEFIANPSAFFVNKVWPRRHKKLAPMANLSFDNVVEFGHYASMSQFADPEMKEMLLTLIAAGEQSKKWIEAQGILNATALEMQCPLGSILGAHAPYDMLADNLRGYIELPMDLEEIPEKVLAAIDVMTGYALKEVDAVKAAGLDYVFMPLHGGTDDFMSDETYLKFYMPSLKIVLEHALELGITPYVFFEGKYNNRLEILRDVYPKGIIGMFEQVDLKKAKSILEGHMCICGNIAGASLVYGKPEEIVDATKKMIDDCAPGGGFIMDCSIVMDHYNEANFDAWYETTMKYGSYK